MSSERTITSLAITLAAAATLSVAGCKKDQQTASPEDDAGDQDTGAVVDDELDAPTDDGASEPDDEVEPAASMLTKASFDETINEHFQEVSDCYIAALEGNPDLKGTLNAEFQIGAAGEVLGVVAVDDSTLMDEGMLACISEAASAWTFDTPPDGEMNLRYKFELVPG